MSFTLASLKRQINCFSILGISNSFSSKRVLLNELHIRSKDRFSLIPAILQPRFVCSSRRNKSYVFFSVGIFQIYFSLIERAPSELQFRLINYRFSFISAIPPMQGFVCPSLRSKKLNVRNLFRFNSFKIRFLLRSC